MMCKRYGGTKLLTALDIQQDLPLKPGQSPMVRKAVLALRIKKSRIAIGRLAQMREGLKSLIETDHRRFGLEREIGP